MLKSPKKIATIKETSCSREACASAALLCSCLASPPRRSPSLTTGLLCFALLLAPLNAAPGSEPSKRHFFSLYSCIARRDSAHFETFGTLYALPWKASPKAPVLADFSSL